MWVLILGALPQITWGAGGVVQCGGQGEPDCTFPDILKTLQRIIDTGTTMVLIPILTIVILVGGFQIVTSGGNPGKYKEGLGKIKGAAFGLAFVLCAYLIVNTVVKLLLS